MDSEQLRQEAEEKYNERLKQNGIAVEYKNETYIDGYLDSAEPRERKIAEAKKIIKDLLDTQYRLDPYRDIFKDRIAAAEQFISEVESDGKLTV